MILIKNRFYKFWKRMKIGDIYYLHFDLLFNPIQ
jgi:hypothetical protein